MYRVERKRRRGDAKQAGLTERSTVKLRGKYELWELKVSSIHESGVWTETKLLAADDDGGGCFDRL